MRITTAVLAFLLFLVTGCSSRPSSSVQLLQPEVALHQAPMSQFLLQYPGPISVSFQFAVRNPSGEPITLRRLELQNIGSGAYIVRRFPLIFSKVIQPEQTELVSFSVNAWAQGGRLGSIEPVTLRGIAYFDSPTGKFHRIFIQTLRPTTGEY